MTSYAITAAALDKIEALGSPAAIADYFEARGITGRRESSSGCPVAVYLTRETAIPHLVGVGCTVPDPYTVAGEYKPRDDSSVSLGPNVSAFILAFDAGEFPTLDRPRFRTYALIS